MKYLVITCICCLLMVRSLAQVHLPVQFFSDSENNLAALFLKGPGSHYGASYQQSLLQPDGQTIRYMDANFVWTSEISESSEWFSTSLDIQSTSLNFNRSRFSRSRFLGAYSRHLMNVGQWRHFLSLGISANWDQWSIRPSGYWYSSQYDLENQQVDRSIPSGETSNNRTGDAFNYAQLAFGLHWLARLSSKFSWTAGISAYNLGFAGAPDQSPDRARERRFNFSINSNWAVSNDLKLIAGAQYERQSPYNQMLFRFSALSTSSKAHQAPWFQLGFGTRFSNHVERFGWTAFNVFTQIQVNRLGIGLIYEFPLGSLARHPGFYGNMGIAFKFRPGSAKVLHWN